jgi:peptide/nickel transport system substrate-binding protein
MNSLRLCVAFATASIWLAACSGGATPAAPATSAPPSAATSAAAPTVASKPTSAAAPTAAPKPTAAPAAAAAASQLNIGENIWAFSVDADVNYGGYALQAFGVAENVTKITRDMQVVPSIASKVEAIDPLTWRITVRDDVTFQDRTKVDAQAIQASLQRSIAMDPAAPGLIPKDATFSPEGQVLTLKTPTPVGSMPANLASYDLTIKKVAPDGKVIYTGPYIITDYVETTSMSLMAYDGYKPQPAKIKNIQVRYIPDTSSRVLALQSGDIDMAFGLLPTNVAQLKSAGFNVFSFGNDNQTDMILNNTKAPLDDPVVRQAVSLGIDRDILVKSILQGEGSAAKAFVPDLGIKGVVATQKSDPAEANRQLDAAGWQKGSDGIRTKGGQRLAMSLGFAVKRPEQPPMATAIKDQLQAIGMDVTLKQDPDVNTTVANNSFDAELYSSGHLPYADPAYWIAVLFTPNVNDKDRYDSKSVDSLFEQYNASSDQTQRQNLLEQMQQIWGDDVPVVYVADPNKIVATSKKVTGYVPHPLETYGIDTNLVLN